jgi:lipoprotein-releasing system ATP-binding protein
MIILQKVIKHFANITIVPEVSLTLQKGERWAIMGRSGSGKSTLLHMMAGLDVPSSGTIQWDGCSWQDMSNMQKRAIWMNQIAFVFQKPLLLPMYSVLDNVAIPLCVQGLSHTCARQRAQACLAKIGLRAKIHDFPHTLSGGEAQRVALARAIVKNPDILFADEPTSHLDRDNAQELFKWFHQLAMEHTMTVVCVTHDHTWQAYATHIHRQDTALA